MTLLKNNQWTEDRRLDRVRQVDLRSLDYPVSAVLTADQYRVPRSYTWPLSTHLDQGREGACVGFGFSHELAAKPVMLSVNDNFARNAYFEIQMEDPWAGGAYPGASPFYEGTSVLSGAKWFAEQGYYDEYRWALSMEDLYVAVGYRGPAVIGVDWYEGMFQTDHEGFIRATGQISGGHCICVNGVSIKRNDDDTVDHLRSNFILHNSWGRGWGVNGRARLSFADMAILWSSGDFVIPVRRANPNT